MTLPHRLFVVAAHPDDDSIGCGGAIARVVASGGSVRVAYLTDGGGSHTASRRFPPARVAELREGEARAALAILGVTQEPAFFRLPDSGLATLERPRRLAAVTRLADAIGAFSPGLVFAPWIRDPHPDHIACAEIARDALATLASPPQLACYEVWLPVRGTGADRPQPGEARSSSVTLDAPTRRLKRDAILAHRTQTSDLIDDDPAGFRIDAALVNLWTGPTEYYHTLARSAPADCGVEDPHASS